MNMDMGRPPLGAMALYIDKPAWIDGEPTLPGVIRDVVWSGVGPADVPIFALRDGFIVFAFDKSAKFAGGSIPTYMSVPGEAIPDNVRAADTARRSLLYKRLEYMNAFLAALYSAFATVQKTAVHVQPPVDPASYYLCIAGANESWTILTPQSMPVSQGHRQEVKTETVANALDVMHGCVQRFEDKAYTLLSLIYTACHQYALHQFPSAHLIAWSVIEMQLNIIWSELLDRLDDREGGHTRINSERRKGLTGTSYTASIVTQMLSLHREIDDELLASLDAARQKRNEFAHKLGPVGADDAGKVLRTASTLISRIVGTRVESQLALAYWM